MATNLDFSQVLQRAFDESTDRLKVDTQATINVEGGIVEVAVDQTTDSIKIGDGTNLVGTTNDSGTRGFNSHLTNTSLPLPTGASTSALQTTGNSLLSSIDSKIPANLTVENNRLLVDPDFDVMWFVVPLLNSGSKNMNVDGSSTPVNFSFSPSSGKVYVKEVSFFIADSGTTSPNKFGKVAALTNGVQLQIQSKGIIYNVANIKDNSDIINTFADDPLIPSASAGFLDTNDAYSGNLIYDRSIVLDNATSDYIQFIIQDDVSGIDFLQANIKYRINT